MEQFDLKAAIEQHNKRGEILDDILMTDRTIEIIEDNVGNMKSWLVVTFNLPKQFDSQFFILRVIGCLLLIKI